MRFRFCKNSVFGILFLIFFCLGTICGVLLFRYFYSARPDWIAAYCSKISGAVSPVLWLQILFAIWPLLAVLAVGLLPYGERLLPVLILLRGCLLAYSAAASYTTGHSFAAFFVRDLLLLPVFYCLCRRFYSKPYIR